MSSPYADLIAEFVQEVDQAFYSVFNLTGPYQETDYLPGERYGMFDFQTYDRDPRRTALRSVRGGVEAKVFRASIVISVAFDEADLNLRECLVQANQIYLSEALNLEDGLVEVKRRINDWGCFWDIDLDSPVDKAVSVTLKDSPRTWLVSATTSVAINLMVNRDLAGNHVLPLSADNTGA